LKWKYNIWDPNLLKSSFKNISNLFLKSLAIFHSWSHWTYPNCTLLQVSEYGPCAFREIPREQYVADKQRSRILGMYLGTYLRVFRQSAYINNVCFLIAGLEAFWQVSIRSEVYIYRCYFFPVINKRYKWARLLVHTLHM
jgi:hypothetical protein